MNEGIMGRYMKAVTHDMIKNNQTEIKCPCHRYKLMCYIDPYSGQLQSHLLSRCFMNGYTRGISDEDDDNVHGAATGNDEEGHGGDEDFPGHDESGEDAEHGGEDQDAGHGQDVGQDEEYQDAGHGEEDQDAGADGTPSGSWVQNPYVQALLLKQTSNARDAAREKAKLASLEKDAVSPFYAGCRPGDTRLDITLRALQMKARHKWTDKSFDENMAFWQERLPEGNKCLTSIEEAKKTVCPLDLPHMRYHACINDCMIYRGEDAERNTCPVCGAS
jgi:hypothetical protein